MPDLSAERIEHFQEVGIRLALVFGSIDPVGTLPNNWDPSPTSINRTESDWTITGIWHANVGLNYFQPDDQGEPRAWVSFKLDPSRVPDLPAPRPKFEIWVYSQRDHIWIGQNGQDLWEQVYLVERGANYGWSVYEADSAGVIAARISVPRS